MADGARRNAQSATEDEVIILILIAILGFGYAVSTVDRWWSEVTNWATAHHLLALDHVLLPVTGASPGPVAGLDIARVGVAGGFLVVVLAVAWMLVRTRRARRAAALQSQR